MVRTYSEILSLMKAIVLFNVPLKSPRKASALRSTVTKASEATIPGWGSSHSPSNPIGEKGNGCEIHEFFYCVKTWDLSSFMDIHWRSKHVRRMPLRPQMETRGSVEYAWQLFIPTLHLVTFLDETVVSFGMCEVPAQVMRMLSYPSLVLGCLSGPWAPAYSASLVLGAFLVDEALSRKSIVKILNNIMLQALAK